MQDKLTDKTPYMVTKKELLATSLPERAPRQAPRHSSVLLAALEELVADSNGAVYFRILSRWLLSRAWSGLPITET